jgi:hypothetical protein
MLPLLLPLPLLLLLLLLLPLLLLPCISSRSAQAHWADEKAIRAAFTRGLLATGDDDAALSSPSATTMLEASEAKAWQRSAVARSRSPQAPAS